MCHVLVKTSPWHAMCWSGDIPDETYDWSRVWHIIPNVSYVDREIFTLACPVWTRWRTLTYPMWTKWCVGKAFSLTCHVWTKRIHTILLVLYGPSGIHSDMSCVDQVMYNLTCPDRVMYTLTCPIWTESVALDTNTCTISYGSIGKTSPDCDHALVKKSARPLGGPYVCLPPSISYVDIPCPRDDLAWPSSRDWPPLVGWAIPVLCGHHTHCGFLDMDGHAWEEMTSTRHDAHNDISYRWRWKFLEDKSDHWIMKKTHGKMLKWKIKERVM